MANLVVLGYPVIMPTRPFRNHLGDLVEIPEIAATQAKNTFGELLDRVSASGPIAITRHDTPRAVLLSYEEFESLRNARSKTLETLSTSFDDLLERLHKPGARKAMDAAFHATPEELGRAAVEAAKRRR
ncbi:MAG TPA: type II toxin-antitoxin system Phd/YefM family antitoxin [Thermoanaerobaculia bacterium]|nr:type II toxin-antitoxin system Phd/YefM family antitoxin [Thermoanaerobaculia bacterium]